MTTSTILINLAIYMMHCLSSELYVAMIMNLLYNLGTRGLS